MCDSDGLKLLLTVSISAALCPEEAESALEATHFFTDDDTLQGKYSVSYTWYNTHICAKIRMPPTTYVHDKQLSVASVLNTVATL